MAQYEKVFTKPYEDGYVDLPNQTTPITAETLNDKDAAIEHIEDFLDGQEFPTVNDAVLTIQKNGADVATFSANDDENVTANIAVPTSEEKTTTTGKFTTTTGGKLESCLVDFEPIQDLHGYDHPWVGGSGKNKLGIKVSDVKPLNTIGTWSGNTYAISGGNIIFNEDVDGYITSITLDGAFDYDIYPILQNESTYANQMRIFVDRIDSSSWNLAILNSTNTSIVAYASTGGTVINADSYGRFRFWIKKDVTYNNYTIYFMVCLSTVSDATFEPYSNVCQIEGHTAVEVLNRGFNLWDEIIENGEYNQTTGQPVSDNSKARGKNPILIEPNTEYCFYCESARVSGIFWYDANDDFISYTQNASSSVFTATSPQNAKYVRIQFSTAYGTTYKNDCCVNVSDENVNGTYEPYKGQDVIVNLGGTYYGGTLNVVSGEFTGYVVSDEFDGSNDETIEVVAGTVFNRISCAISSDSITNSSTTEKTNKIWSDKYEEITDSLSNAGTIGIYYRANGSHKAMISPGDVGITDVASARTWLSNNPVQICYELATPIVVQLTPQQINALVGENNIDVPLTGQSLTSAVYRELFAWSDVEDVVELRLPISAIGTDESNNDTASQAYSQGDYFYKNGIAKAKTSIASGATFTLGTNYEIKTLAEILKALES